MSEKAERHFLSHVFNVAILVLGAALLAWMLHKLGWETIKSVLRSVRGWFPLLIALDVAAMMLDAAAIHAYMRPEARIISYWRVLAAQASGRAVNIFVPGGAVGEATKVTMLVDRAPRGRVVSSIVLFNVGSIYISVIALLIGVPITSLLIDLPHRLLVAVWIGIAVALAGAIALGLVIRRGTLATVVDTARIFRLLSKERRADWKAKLANIDSHLRTIDPRKGGARLGLALQRASRLVTWTATTAVLHAVGVPITAKLLVGVFSVGVLIGWISSIVPLGVGVADGSNNALYTMLGAPPNSGLLVTLLDRVRRVTVAILGLGAMAVVHTLNRVALARRTARMAALVEAASRNEPAPEAPPEPAPD